MQRLYLFSNFCLLLTLALLTTQPVKAEPSVRIIGVSEPTGRDIVVKPLKAKFLSYKFQTKSDRTLGIVKQNKVAVARKAKESGVELYFNLSPNSLRLPTKPEEVQSLEVRPISLQQALELALRNSHTLQTAQLSIESSEAALRAVQAAKYPTLGLSTSIDNSGSYIFSHKPISLSQNDINTNSTGLSGGLELNYDLFTSGRRPATIQQAQEQLRSVRLDFERIRDELHLNVSTAYYNLQQADENVRIQQAAVTNAQASLRNAQNLKEAGMGTRYEVLTFQAVVGEATQNLANALSQQRISSRELATLLSLPETVIITAADPVKIAGPWKFSLEQSIVQAYKNRPELQQLLAERNIHQQERRIALSALGPQISLTATYNPKLSLSGSNSQQNQGFTDECALSAKVSLSLFDGGAARAEARQAEAKVAIAETNFANQHDQIRLEVERAHSQLQSNFENIQTATASLKQAEEAFELARLRFKARVSTQTEVIDAENRLTQAEGNRVNAILSYNRFLAQLQRAISSSQQG